MPSIVPARARRREYRKRSAASRLHITLALLLAALPLRAQKVVYTARFDAQTKIAREEDWIAKDAAGVWHRTARPPADAEWIAEGQGSVAVRGGKLHVMPTAPGSAQRSHMVVWNRHIFPADFVLEFDMNPEGSAGGLAIVFFCAAGPGNKDIFDLSLPPRRADYPAYHSGAIANYSDAYWSRNTEEESASNRLRRNPGFQLVAEGPSLTKGPTNVTYKVRISKRGGHIETAVNGKVALQWDDPSPPLGAGRIGLRSMEGVTAVTYSNFKVSAY